MIGDTNEKRAELAFRTVLAFQSYGGGDPDDIEASIIDLATNLLHLAEQYGLESDDLQRTSRHHFNDERIAEASV